LYKIVDPEIFTSFFSHKILKKAPLPFTESQILEERDEYLQSAMGNIDALFALKMIGELEAHLVDEENKLLMAKALAVLRNANKISTSQGVAIVKQLLSS